jgi:hypothetical protein
MPQYRKTRPPLPNIKIAVDDGIAHTRERAVIDGAHSGGGGAIGSQHNRRACRAWVLKVDRAKSRHDGFSFLFGFHHLLN